MAGLNDLNQVWQTAGPLEGCSGNGVLANNYTSSDGLSGDHTLSFNLNSGCGGQKLSLAPGDSIYLVTSLLSPTNRGGFVDALSTLRVGFDYDNIVFTGTSTRVGAEALAQTLGVAVPEPAGWAMMIAGFGMIGAAVRRRRTVQVTFA